MPTKQNKIKNDIQILNSLLNDIDWHIKIKEIELLIKNLNKINKTEFKKEFTEIDEIKNNFLKKKKIFYRTLDNERNKNLKLKNEIINEIKELVNSNDKTHIVYSEFKKLQKKWYSLGPVPIYESNNIWQTFKHHIERFYNFLHLNRELRERDFKHNYNEKIKIIEEAELLAKDAEKDIHKSVRELNNLHRLWKNELGPVEKKYSDELWKRFQKSSRLIHKKKNIYYKERENLLKENLIKKNKIIDRINHINNDVELDFSNIKKISDELNILKNEFQLIGKTSNSNNKKIWSDFRLSLKKINNKKNDFYKSRKKEINNAIKFKKELIHKIKNILKDDDLQKNINIVKNIQKEWKELKGIPKKISDKLWDEFKKVCGEFFNNIKNKESYDSKKDIEKINLLNDYLSKTTIPKKIKGENEYLEFLSELIEKSKKITSNNKRLKIKTNELIIKKITEIIDVSKFNSNMKEKIKFDLNLIIILNCESQINSEKNHLNLEKNKIKNELIQLQNNLEFFSKSSEKNPMYIEANEKITSLNNKVLIIDEKVKKINNLVNNINLVNEPKEET
mgnify:FL=1|tara:strand:+ start:2430 stop:4121 length:1692 start_codon:yes stop_codon:yes gene_type:complete